MIKYKYDGRGNHAVLAASGADIASATHIGNLNPFRYRGYCYDTETGLYFLKTRCYDPDVGRFVTIVDIAKSRGETYFHTTNDVWNATGSLKGVGNRGMRKINKAFLKPQIQSGANFILTAQPSGCFYAKEVAWVIKHAVYMF